MKISAIRSLIKEAISDMELSLELSNGKIIHGLARKDPKALSLQIGNNTYFSFWEGKFILSGTGDVTIVRGVDDYSQEWFLKATEEYLKAMEDTYPEKFKYNITGPIGMNESTSRDAFMAGWNQSKANLGKGKIKGDLRDIDAWMKYSQGEGSEEEKDAFMLGWFKARTTTNLSDVETPLNENTSGVDYISVKIKKDGGFLKQVKGKVKPTDIGFIIYNEKNDGKPYNIIWDRKRNKFINGETIWYNVEDVIPDLGYEEDFIKLERPFA